MWAKGDVLPRGLADGEIHGAFPGYVNLGVGSAAFIYALHRVGRAQGTGNGKFMRYMSSVPRRR